MLSLVAAAACGDNAPPNPGNLPPTADPSSLAVTLAEEGSIDVEAIATDPEGRDLTYTTTTPAHGTLTGTGPRYRYTGALDFSGIDSFIISASDGINAVQIPVSLTVTPVNDAPRAMADEVTTPEDVAVSVVAVATDVDNATLTYTIVTQPAHGTLTGTAPNFTYTPALHYAGADSFTFTASDGELTSEPATVSLTVENVIACGDGVLEGDEACDDGNQIDTDACRNTCVVASCGDGAVQAGVEECDDGNQVDTDACRNSCVAATCGDGVVQAGVEACDDGNQVDNDSCRNSCAAATCGDGVVQTGVEDCDDGNQVDTDSCRNTCMVATCGDGVVQTGVEACDDGNQVDTDSCRNTCTVATCGDGVVQAGVEQCDDANLSNFDACLNTCQTASCGDGFPQAGVEACDDGNQSNDDACLATCAPASCGDGFTYAGVEACDDGNQSNDDACLATCVSASCGDGFTWSGVEQCDDANQSNGDACLNVCQLATCGDGFVETGEEECDDGNQIDTDACRNDCTAPVCGDGTVDAGEECDDSNTSDNDGCGHTCLLERCGDGFVQLAAGETCDDGNLVPGDGCDAACHVEPFTTTGPILISGSLSCTTSVANAARKIAVDGSGNIYAVMQCGTTAQAASSTNRGNSFSAPYDLSTSLGTVDTPAVVSQVAVGNGPTGVAYAAIMLSDGRVFLRVTQDAGLTWAPGVLVGQAVSTSSGLSLQSFNDNVYVGFSVSGGVAVARNNSRGAGSFDITPVTMSIAFFDLVYDITLGTLAVVADTPGFHIRVSNDGGVSFNAEVNPPGQEYYSDWTIGNGFIFVSGTNLGASGDSDSVYRIPSSDPTTSTRIFGLPAISTAQTRTVAADAAGNLFAGSQLNGGGVQLDYLPAGTTTFSTPRTVSATGGSPIVSGLPGNSGAAMVYTDGTGVYATIQVYP